MKILILNDDFPPFGWSSPGQLACNTAKALVKRGHEVSVLTTTQDKTQAGVKEIDNLKYYVLYSDYHIRWRNYVSLSNRLLNSQVGKIIEEIKPEVVHCHNLHLHLSYQSIVVASKYCRRIFLTAHDYLLFSHAKITKEQIRRKYSANDFIKQAGKRYNPLRNLIIRKKIKRLKKIFALSSAQKEILLLNKINNVEVLYNSIDVSEWQANDYEVKNFKDKNKLNNKKVIFFAARMSPEKGLGKTLEAFDLISQKKSDCVLLLAGNENNYTKKIINSLDDELRQKIIFTGWLTRREIKTGYYAADVVLTPSLYPDPFNMINLEAMSSHKPIVGTCYGGTPEIVKDGVTGYIVDPFNAGEIAKKCVCLLKNEALARRLGENGYRRAVEKFSLEKHLNKLLLYYEGDNKK